MLAIGFCRLTCFDCERPSPPPHRVRAETASKTGMVMVFGEITCPGNIDYQKVRCPAFSAEGGVARKTGHQQIDSVTSANSMPAS